MKVVFEFEINGIKRAVTKMKDVRKAVADIQDAMLQTKKGTKEYEKLTNTLGQLKQIQSNVAKETKRAQAALEEAPKKATGYYNELKDNIKRIDEAVKSLTKGESDSELGKNLKERLVELKQELKDYNKSISTNEKNVKHAKGSYREMNAELVQLRNRYKNMPEAERKVAGKALLKRIGKLDNDLKQLDGKMGNYQRNVGNYASAFKGLGKVLGAGFLIGGASEIIQGITQSIVEGVQVYADFSSELSTLKAISGATSEELKELEKDAKRIGATSQFTAKEVAGLQIAFARLGFSTTEILQATEATKNLSIATKSDLASSAKVVAQSVRAYGLSASEAGRVTDVLTASFNSSGLQLETFAEASKLLAPVSKILGISIEESTAAIGLLADTGLEGTVATTTLATSLQRLADPTAKYAEAAKAAGVEVFNQKGEFVGLTELVRNVQEATGDMTEQNRLATISQIFGQQSTKNWALLLEQQKDVTLDGAKATYEGADALEAYTKSLKKSGGEARKTADIVEDNLATDFVKYSSAVEALQIKIFGTFDGILRAGTQFVTNLIGNVGNGFDFLVEAFSPVFEALGELVSLFYDGETVGSLFGSVMNIVGGVISVFAQILTFLVRQVVEAVSGVKNMINTFPLLGSAINIVRKAFLGLYRGISLIPAILSGVMAVVLVAQKRLSDFGKKAVLSAQIVLKDLEGLVSKAAKDEAKLLREQQKSLGEGGKSLGDAFNEGFSKAAFTIPDVDISKEVITDKVVKSAKTRAKELGNEIGDTVAGETISSLKARKKELENALENAVIGSEAKAKIESELKEITKSLNLAQGKTSDGKAKKELSETASAFEKLKARQKELKTEIINARIEGKEYSKQLTELKEVSEKLADAENLVKDATKETDEALKGAKGSVSQLSEVVNELQQDLDNASPEKVEEIAKALQQAQNELKIAKDKIDEALNTEGSGVSDAAIKSIEERLEKEKLLKIQALRAENLSTERFAIEKANIELEYTRLTAEEKAKLYEKGSLERLRLLENVAKAEEDINKKSISDAKATLEKKAQLATIGLNAAQGVVESLDEINTNLADARVSELEGYYANQIELAEGNEERQMELEQELEVERDKIRRKEFEKSKKMQVAAATISYFQGLINIITAPSVIPDPAGAIFKGVQAAALTGIYLSNVNKIKKSQYAERGEVTGGKERLRGIRNSIENSDVVKLGFEGGKSHAEGGNFTVFGDTLLETERGEFKDFDEYGRLVTINKKSARKYRKELLQTKGVSFPGKLDYLSNINSYRNFGKVFAERGTVVPSLSTIGNNNTGLNNGMTIVQTKASLSNKDIVLLAQQIGLAVEKGAKKGATDAEKERAINEVRNKRFNNKIEQ